LKQFEDYGCPDWRDADGYGDFELWDDVNWRWQFKRRWRDYRIVFGDLCYQNHLECYPDRPIPVFPMWMPEYRDAYFFASPAQAARFDFPRLFNPLNANLPDHQWDALRDATTRFERRTVTAADFINNKDTKHKPRDVFGSGSIAITFNLYSPIGGSKNAPLIGDQTDNWLCLVRCRWRGISPSPASGFRGCDGPMIDGCRESEVSRE
jgi:hypothetical protein